jgi:CRP-like cAMP-binding protein
MKDEREEPKELAQLGRNSYFGEIALLTTEPRSASVVVKSPVCKCLVMTKAKFDELLATTYRLQAENRKLIGRDVLDRVPLFASLSNTVKGKLLEVMLSVTFQPSTYICRHGAPGNNLYVITEGTCRVTINTEDKGEVDIALLRPGDFFGEVEGK